MANPLIVETFVEYGIGIFFLLLRLIARWKVVGVRNFGLGDFFAISAMGFWTTQTTIIYFLDVYGNNIGLNTETAMAVPDGEIPKLVLGSKLAFTNWIWYLCYIWCLKGVLLCLFTKLTEGLWQQRLVHGMCVFVAATWLACILTHICICTPIPRSWQIKPYPGDDCTIRRPNYVVIAVLNVLSDLGIILIPIPLLFKLKVALPRKIILIAMFSSGLFIMLCTILRAYYSLKSIQTLSIALGWADRECFVAAIVVSLPGIKPLFRNTSWLGSSNKSQKYGENTSNRTTRKYPWSNRSGGHTNTEISTHNSAPGDHFELSARRLKNTLGASRLSSDGSAEHILSTQKDLEGDPNNAIHVTTEYILEEERRDEI